MSSNIVNLVVVAHPDDEILGFGGTGKIRVEAGDSVQPIILCGEASARNNRPSQSKLHEDIQLANSVLGFNNPVLGNFPNIQMNNVPHLELVKFIEEQISIHNPRRVFTHHPSDLNDDHGWVAKACMAASRLSQRRQIEVRKFSLFFMEILSSTDWAFPGHAQLYEPNCFVNIETSVEEKINALAQYKGVMRESPHPRSAEVIRGLAAYRGGQSGFKYAESFQTAFTTDL